MSEKELKNLEAVIAKRCDTMPKDVCSRSDCNTCIAKIVIDAGYIKLPSPDSKEYQELRERIFQELGYSIISRKGIILAPIRPNLSQDIPCRKGVENDEN